MSDTLSIRVENGVASLSGPLTLQQVSVLQTLRKTQYKQVDLSGVPTLDTAGALFLLEAAGAAELVVKDAQQKHLLEMLRGLSLGELPCAEPRDPLHQAMVDTGKTAISMKDEAKRVLTFGGKAAVMLVHALHQPGRLRRGAISQHIHAIGVQALPIIGLMAFLIAVVLAYQGVAQLRPYGGEQFTVNLVALSILREMGVLLTAIMVAGRSGSAFTAEIGVMKAREEVDALQVMGLDPFDMLVTPRLVAITIALPLLTFYACIMGLVGGFLICHFLIGITLPQYIEQVHVATQGADLFVGLSKAPVFAFMIGIVGCMHGLRVTGSAESIGAETTRAVVKSIFLVLVLDAFFSIFFEQVGL